MFHASTGLGPDRCSALVRLAPSDNLIGSNFLKGSWHTQNRVILSSAEAGLIALVKCSAELLGMRSATKDWGVESSGVVYADSSTAVAIANRKGAGKLRHINISTLWIQERQDREDLELRKVLGTENPADVMTKYLTRESTDKCMGYMSQERLAGRAEAGLQVRGGGDKKKESARGRRS